MNCGTDDADNISFFLLLQHFVFGVVYSVGIVEVSLESASLLLILSLIAGLSLTLTTFLMWT